MTGLIEEGKETIEKNEDKEELASDLALIAAAQKVEHYEISGYGTRALLSAPFGNVLALEDRSLHVVLPILKVC